MKKNRLAVTVLVSILAICITAVSITFAVMGKTTDAFTIFFVGFIILAISIILVVLIKNK